MSPAEEKTLTVSQSEAAEHWSAGRADGLLWGLLGLLGLNAGDVSTKPDPQFCRQPEPTVLQVPSISQSTSKGLSSDRGERKWSVASCLLLSKTRKFMIVYDNHR